MPLRIFIDIKYLNHTSQNWKWDNCSESRFYDLIPIYWRKINCQVNTDMRCSTVIQHFFSRLQIASLIDRLYLNALKIPQTCSVHCFDIYDAIKSISYADK